MPRRNQRDERWTGAPLDLTPAEIARTPSHPGAVPLKSREQRDREHQERIERQRKAKIAGGLDWSVCMVPNCGSYVSSPPATMRDAEERLPLCIEHQMVAWRQVQRTNREPDVIAANAMLRARTHIKQQAREDELAARRKASIDGDIYILKTNGVIKVGWSRGVQGRIRHYGPETEVLCIYPGTRDDETALHRTFRPYLARGREWYEDCKIIRDYAEVIVEKHGEPRVHDSWTRPKDPAVRMRRR